MAGLLADCHVHFEGTLPEEALQRLAARAGHAFANHGKRFERHLALLRQRAEKK